MPSISLDEVNKSGRRHEVRRSVPNTTANAVCYIHWHYCVVGVTVTLALLERGSVLLKRHPAACRMQTTATKEVQFIGSTVPFSDVLMACPPGLSHCKRQVMICEVSCP